MNILGLVEYESDSDQSTEQNSQTTNNTTESIKISVDITQILPIEVTGNVEVGSEFLKVDDNNVFSTGVSATSLNDSNAKTDESKYKYLHKLPHLDPNVLTDKNTSDSVNYYLEAMKMHDFNLTEVRENCPTQSKGYLLIFIWTSEYPHQQGLWQPLHSAERSGAFQNR
jgi:hypothetical protein